MKEELTIEARALKDRQDQLQAFEHALEDPLVALRKQYSAFDEDGYPLRDAEGMELPKGARNKLRKQVKKQIDSHQAAIATLEANPNALASLRGEITALEAQLT